MTLFGDLPVFLGLTVVLFGAAAWLTGAAIGGSWRPLWQVLAYGLLLTLFDRFLHFALFGGALLSVSGLVRDYVVICGVALVAWRVTRVALMVRQYPWLYRAAGPLVYRPR